MKMDLAGPGGAQALGVAGCQSQPSDIWEQLNAKGGREQRFTREYNFITLSCYIIIHCWWLIRLMSGPAVITLVVQT